MATIDSKAFIDRLIAGDGRIDPEDAPDNPWALKIVEFTNMAGRRTWGVVFEGERDTEKYERVTQYVQEPQVIWTKAQGVLDGRG